MHFINNDDNKTKICIFITPSIIIIISSSVSIIKIKCWFTVIDIHIYNTCMHFNKNNNNSNMYIYYNNKNNYYYVITLLLLWLLLSVVVLVLLRPNLYL